MEFAHLHEKEIEYQGGHGPQGQSESGNTLKRRGPGRSRVGECRGIEARRSRAPASVHHAVVDAQGTAGSGMLPAPPDGRK